MIEVKLLPYAEAPRAETPVPEPPGAYLPYFFRPQVTASYIGVIKVVERRKAAGTLSKEAELPVKARMPVHKKGGGEEVVSVRCPLVLRAYLYPPWIQQEGR